MEDKEKKEAIIKIEIEEGEWNYSWKRQGRTFRVEVANSKEDWTEVIKEVVKYLEEAKEQDR